MSVKISVADRIKRMRAKDDRHEGLWSRIVADNPGLENPDLDDWRFVNLLRTWTFRNVRREARVAGEAIAGFLDSNESFGFYGRDAPDIFEAFEENLGGVIGGGCCWSMYTVYDAFDYTAAIIDTGEKRGEYSRIGVVVEIYHDGDFVWAVQDPNYDFALADCNGEPISYFRALAYLARGEDDKLQCLAGDPEAWRLIITYPHQEGKLHSDWTIREGSEPVVRLEDGRALYRAHMSWASFQKKNSDPRPFNVLARAGLPPRVIYFFAMPFGVYPGHIPHRQMLWERISYVLEDIGPLTD